MTEPRDLTDLVPADVRNELDRAAAHCRVAATHFRGAEVPRGAAHAWAALRHLREAELRLEEQARTHRLKARL